MFELPTRMVRLRKSIRLLSDFVKIRSESKVAERLAWN